MNILAQRKIQFQFLRRSRVLLLKLEQYKPRKDFKQFVLKNREGSMDTTNATETGSVYLGEKAVSSDRTKAKEIQYLIGY